MLLLRCQEQVVGSSFLNSSSRALPIQYLIIADDRPTRKCGSVSTCADFIQTERLFTNYSVTIPLLHARAKNIYQLAAGSAELLSRDQSEVLACRAGEIQMIARL
jgi:hypothetical protein